MLWSAGMGSTVSFGVSIRLEELAVTGWCIGLFFIPVLGLVILDSVSPGIRHLYRERRSGRLGGSGPRRITSRRTARVP